MHAEHRSRGRPGGTGPSLEQGLRELARRNRACAMDADLPDRVMAALGLAPTPPAAPPGSANAPTSPPRPSRRRAALTLGLGAILSLVWLPSGGERDVRRAGSPLFGPPVPVLAPTPRRAPPASVPPLRSTSPAAAERAR